MMASFQTQKAKPKSHERFYRPALQDLPSTSAHGLIRSAGKCPAEQRDERDWFGQELGCGGPSPYSPQDSDFCVWNDAIMILLDVPKFPKPRAAKFPAF